MPVNPFAQYGSDPPSRVSAKKWRRERIDAKKKRLKEEGKKGKALADEMREFVRKIDAKISNERERRISEKMEARRAQRQSKAQPDIGDAPLSGFGSQVSNFVPDMVDLGQMAQSFISQGAQETSLGQLPNVAGGITAIAPSLSDEPVSGGFGERFQQGREDAQDKLTMLQRESPISSTAGMFGGGMVGPAAKLGRLGGKAGMEALDAPARYLGKKATGRAARIRGAKGLGDLVEKGFRTESPLMTKRIAARLANVYGQTVQNTAAAAGAIGAESLARNMLTGTTQYGREMEFNERLERSLDTVTGAMNNPWVMVPVLVSGISQGAIRVPEDTPMRKRLERFGIDPHKVTPDVLRPDSTTQGIVSTGSKVATPVRKSAARRIERLYRRPLFRAIDNMQKSVSGPNPGRNQKRALQRVAGSGRPAPGESFEPGAVVRQRERQNQAFFNSPHGGGAKLSRDELVLLNESLRKAAKKFGSGSNALSEELAAFAKQASSKKPGEVGARGPIRGQGAPSGRPARSDFTWQEVDDLRQRWSDRAHMSKRFKESNVGKDFSPEDIRAYNDIHNTLRLFVKNRNPTMDRVLEEAHVLRQITEDMKNLSIKTMGDEDAVNLMRQVMTGGSFDRQWAALKAGGMTEPEIQSFAGHYLGNFLQQIIRESAEEGGYRVLLQTARNRWNNESSPFHRAKFDKVMADAGQPDAGVFLDDFLAVHERLGRGVMSVEGSETAKRAADMALMWSAAESPGLVLSYLTDASRGLNSIQNWGQKGLSQAFAWSFVASAISGGRMNQDLNRLALGESVVGPTAAAAALERTTGEQQ